MTAPSDVTDTRWERKNLIGKVTVDKIKSVNKQLPSDAKLTVFTNANGETRTASYQVNTKGEFIIPFNWTASQEMTFVLGSEQEAESNKSYALKGTIYAGSKVDGNSQPVAVEENLEKQEDIELTMPINTEPALKISGTDKVLSKSENLNVDIKYENVDTKNYSIRAIIQKKDGSEYKGNYCEEQIISQGNHGFTLQATDGAGSYRVWITVSNANGQTLLEVPYYFIIM